MDSKGLCTFAAALICTFFMTAAPVNAQVATGTILGNVTDSTGGAVPGATVTATNVDTQFSRDTTSDESGQYALRLMPLGNYKVDVMLTGFKTVLADGHRARGGSQRPHRRDGRAWQCRRIRFRRWRCTSRRNQHVIAFAHGEPERSAQPAARQSRSVFAVERNGRRDQQRELEFSRRPRAADHDQRITESPGRLSQFPARRRATTPPACAAPAIPRPIPKRFRSSGSSRITTPPNSAAIRPASSTSSPNRGRTNCMAPRSSSSVTRR